MRWAPKIGVSVALLAGLIAAVYLVWSIGFQSIFASVARAGFGGRSEERRVGKECW